MDFTTINADMAMSKKPFLLLIIIRCQHPHHKELLRLKNFPKQPERAIFTIIINVAEILIFHWRPPTLLLTAMNNSVSRISIVILHTLTGQATLFLNMNTAALMETMPMGISGRATDHTTDAGGSSMNSILDSVTMY